MWIAIAASVTLLYALLLVRSPLARVRAKLALAWMLAIVFFPAMLLCAYDDARKGKVIVATAEAAGDVWMLSRWADWRDRLRARRNALLAASRARRRDWHAALAEQRQPVPHQPSHWK